MTYGHLQADCLYTRIRAQRLVSSMGKPLPLPLTHSEKALLLYLTHSVRMPTWLSGSALVSINEVTLRRARLVLGWVTVCVRVNHIGLWPTTQANSAFYSQRDGNEYRPKCGDALRLGSKGRYGSFHLWINVWVAGKTLWDASLIRAIPERTEVNCLL